MEHFTKKLSFIRQGSHTRLSLVSACRAENATDDQHPARCKIYKANLDEIATNADCLTNSEQQSLLKLLKKYEDLFDGTFSTFTSTPYNIKLKDNVEPHHA